MLHCLIFVISLLRWNSDLIETWIQTWMFTSLTASCLNKKLVAYSLTNNNLYLISLIGNSIWSEVVKFWNPDSSAKRTYHCDGGLVRMKLWQDPGSSWNMDSLNEVIDKTCSGSSQCPNLPLKLAFSWNLLDLRPDWASIYHAVKLLRFTKMPDTRSKK